MKRNFILLLAVLISATNLYSQNPKFFLYETENGYTYVNKDFKPIINKTFKFAGRFFEGLAAASENGYVGYINTQGDFVIKPDYEYALPFHNGIAKVWKNGKPYLINKKGKILFEHNYKFIKYAINNSFEPIFIVTTQAWKRGVIDKNGKVLVDITYNDIQQFHENRAIIQNQKQEFGVVNRKGTIVVPFGKYSEIGNFNSLRAAVKSQEWDYNTVGFIDTLGNLVFKEEKCESLYRELPTFSDGLVVIRNADNKRYKLINIQGHKVYDSKEYITVLKYGYAAVRDTTAYVVKNNIINKQGKIIFQNADNVIKENDNLFFVDETEIKDEKGIVVKKENIIIENQDYYAKNYFINKNLVITGKKQGNYMTWSSTNRGFTPDYSNNDFTYLDPEGFKDGLLYVIFYDNRYSNLVWGYIDEDGKIVYKNHPQGYFNKGVKLNINYMEYSGLFSSTPDDTIKQHFSPNQLSFVLDSTVYEKSINNWLLTNKRLCHRFRIINETTDTLLMQESIGQIFHVQAKDKNGLWRNIQTIVPTDVISSTIYKLEPNKFWEYAIQAYSGGFKTKMRVVVKIPAVYVFNQDNFTETKLTDDKEFISNEIDCEINASQFVRNQFTKSTTESYPFEDYEFDRIRSIP
jgi:hypothetical protein